MNEVYVLDKEFIFKNNIHAITSISIENNYEIENSNLAGEFIISGDYRLHEVSINKEDFSFKVPFNADIKSNVNLESIELEITDFTYTAIEDELSVHIEYLVTGEQSLIEFAKESDLEDFLQNNDAEIVDLSEEEIRNPEIIEEIKEEVIEAKEERAHEIIDQNLDKEAIINSIESEENFITYHVHTVVASDTVEGICNKYNINLNDLKKLNNIDELTVNMKLIIADEES